MKKSMLLALGLVGAMATAAAADLAPPHPVTADPPTLPAQTPPTTERVESVPLTPTAPAAGHEAGHEAAAAGHEAAGHEATGHDAGAAGHGGGHHADPTKDFNYVTGVPFGYKSLDIKGGPLGDGKLGVGEHAEAVPAGEKEEPMSAPFILMLVNFGILLIILAKLGGPVARKAAEDRSDQIKHALDEAAALRKAAQAKLDEYGKKLAAADNEIKAMVDGIRADAESEKTRVIAAAEAQAIALKRDADERISAEIDRARATLAREVARASAAAAEKLLRERATSADHGRLIDGFIADLGKPVDNANTKETR